jgi:hypothetical protein
MLTNPTARPRRAPGALLAAVLLATFVTACAGPAHAQVTKPWVPAGDSLLSQATTARMRFKRQQGDSIGGDNYLPFNDTGQLARKLLRSLGREHVLQAPAIEATLDSLGLDTEVAVDPSLPGFVLLLVRNPFRTSSDAVGFLMWYLRDDLRMQGVSFPPARDARLRAWFTGRKEMPYEACVLYEAKGTSLRPGMKLFRMSADGKYWNMIQYEGRGPEFGSRSTLSFADVNNDGRPELLSFHPVDPDSVFVLRSEVPPIVNEFIYTERPEGFVLHDARTVPGPVETLRLFTTLLRAGETERASRLLLDPKRIDEAVANGWPGLTARGAWSVEYGEPNQAWPEWLEVRTADPAGHRRWIFHFYIQDGRWVIRDWKPVVDALAKPPAGAPADSVRGRKP